MNYRLLVRFFLYMFLLYSVSSFLVPILYWTVSKSFEQFTKLPFYLAILACLLFVLSRKFFLRNWFVYFLIFYSIFSLVVGFILNDISSAYLSHIFPYALPILFISFGYYVAKNHPEELRWFIFKMPVLGVILAISCIFYYVMYKLGYLEYYGASSLLVLPFIYYFLKGDFLFSVFFFFLMVLSGKRSDLVCLVFAMLSFFVFRRPFFSALIVIPIAALSIYIFYDLGFLNRFEPLLVLVSGQGDMALLNEFSSNRLNDVIGALNSINRSLFYWVFGQGFGVTYSYDAVNYYHTVHFTHFSPVSYILLGGVVLSSMVYFYFLRLFYGSIVMGFNFFTFYFVYLFFLSLFGGSIFFTNPFYWFVVGVVTFLFSVEKKSNVMRRHTFDF